MKPTGLFACALAVLLLPSPGLACSCMAPPPPAQALGGSAAVFSGLVLRVDRRDWGFRIVDLGLGERGLVAIAIDAPGSDGQRTAEPQNVECPTECTPWADSSIWPRASQSGDSKQSQPRARWASRSMGGNQPARAIQAARMARLARVTGIPTRTYVANRISAPCRRACSIMMRLARLPRVKRLPA